MKSRAQDYLESKILTATPEQLLIMLFDGAIEFAERARPALEMHEHEKANGLLVRAQNIMLELMASLKTEDVGESLHASLMGLYRFVHSRLKAANLQKDLKQLDDAVRILRHLRETWAMALEHERRGRSPELAAAVKSASDAVSAAGRGPLDLAV